MAWPGTGGSAKRLDSKNEVMQANGAWVDKDTVTEAFSSAEPQRVLRPGEQEGPAVICKCYRFEYNQDQGISKKGGCASQVPGLEEHEERDVNMEEEEEEEKAELQAMDMDEQDLLAKIERLEREVVQAQELVSRLDLEIKQLQEGEYEEWDHSKLDQLDEELENAKGALEKKQKSRDEAIEERDRLAEEAQKAQEAAQEAARLAAERAKNEEQLSAKRLEIRLLGEKIKGGSITAEERKEARARMGVLSEEIQEMKANLSVILSATNAMPL